MTALSSVLRAAPSGSGASSVSSGRGVSRRELEQRLRRLDPELNPQSSTFQAAMIVLAAAEVGQNVDRLARVTHLKREFVARSARRLVDGGIWRGGEAVASSPAGSATSEEFWTTVAVAEGKLHRHVDENDRPYWAAPGHWRVLHQEMLDAEAADTYLEADEEPQDEPEYDTLSIVFGQRFPTDDFSEFLSVAAIATERANGGAIGARESQSDPLGLPAGVMGSDQGATWLG